MSRSCRSRRSSGSSSMKRKRSECRSQKPEAPRRWSTDALHTCPCPSHPLFFPIPMLRVKAFQGLRPAPTLVQEVACVPYDVVNREESAALAAGKPHSLLHVDRAEIDLPAETDPYSDAVYAKARENFLGLQKDGALIRES